MINLLRKKYKLSSPEIKRLVGYDIVNYKITDGPKKYILKVYPDVESEIDLAKAENKVLLHVNNKEEAGFPVPVANEDLIYLTPFTEDGNKRYARLLTYLEGTFIGDAVHSKELVSSAGRFLARLDLQLKDYKDYTLEARRFKWDLKHFDLNWSLISHISDPADRKIVNYFVLQYNEIVRPRLPSLRMQVIHNDANEWNTLTRGSRVSGLIDFGDLCYSQMVNEPAISLAYMLLNKKDPVQWAVPFISAYHREFPLEEREIDLLYWLIAARLCTSVINSSYERFKRPGNTYIQISEKPAWELLRKWITINPLHVRNELRKAAGMEIPVEKSTGEIANQRLKSVGSVFSVSYKKPVYMERGAFQYLFDKYGESYLDAYNNIPHVGHSHPAVVEAGQRQMARLNTNTRYLYDQLNEYAEMLLSLFPGHLNKVFFVNSGSAASDLALRIARNYTGKQRIAALEHGYHGNLQSVIDVSHYKFAGKGGKGAGKQVLCLPIPDTFRGIHRDSKAGSSYAGEAIEKIVSSEEPIAAIITEPIVGCGGQIALPKNYLEEIYPVVRKQGGLCISDEVQTGFGRLGHYLWGYEMNGVVPDIVVLGKPIGNGHPLGAVVTTSEIAASFDNGMEFFSSFGGNPVSCAIGMAVLNVMKEEQLRENAKIVGDHYLKQLILLQNQHECIGDVRGSGLFIGVEFVKDRKSLMPDTTLARYLKEEMRNRNILLSTDGPHDNVIKSKPPLCFSNQNADQVIENIDRILKNR